MGYSMQVEDSKFFIPVAKTAAAMEALRATAENTRQMGGTTHMNGKTSRHFSWVNMDYVKRTSLKTMVDCWRWALECDSAGNVIGIGFEGEKMGDDEVLFAALAPFVKRGSYITMRGDDGAVWRWKFDGKACKEQSGRVIFR